MGPSLSAADRPGWNQAGRLARDLRFRGVESEPGQQRDDVGLGFEQVSVLGGARPMPAGARKRRSAGTHARRSHELILGLVAAIGLADFEQPDVGEAAVAVALDGRKQARQQARPHGRHLAGDGVR